ncbi:C45 family peptidase [Pseudonocardia humida]|uniref:Peptidase C45, acyl-coenzyme A -6-aminopenicillanic acid acyl-transferase n=1 Tax=Pseudonocardia humida TaxID=2800819 RepID=A0ABT1A7Y3_9PSEU|nr:C45 family peptidase [Pseudonocardia humida]MCO1658949.1 peptidase C45, acyl-coenzyme A - 6-aminopenicillanic acid acyl-transferase [Pseudonocardia humida]
MSVTTETIAGWGTDFMTVHHVTASGSQADIGRALALRARLAYGWTPAPADRATARARRAWFARHWPQHLERMRGAGRALGVDIEADEVHLDGLTGVPTGSACSAGYYPPATTLDGRPFLGRNYDFFTTSATALFALVSGSPAPDGDEPPMSSRPHVLTCAPDDGPATTLITMNELDGCMEGINEHGLAVALLLADVESTSAPDVAGPQVGLSSTQLPRFLLDTCASAAQAVDALLGAKQYDLGAPLHYLVADRSGDAFVWERGPGGDEHVVRSDGGALCVTNHPLRRHRDPADLPADNPETALTYQRYRTISERSQGTDLSGERMREALDAVQVDSTTDTPYPLRTLWRTVFDLERTTMATRFYLGDAPDGTPRHSPEREFAVPVPHLR